MQYFTDKRAVIGKSILDFFKRQQNASAIINRFESDAVSRVCDFSLQGKMIRGGLVLLSHEMYCGKNTEDALSGAASMELFQSAFLIHDDIMDRDEVRRGKPSVFAQYMNDPEYSKANDRRHLGESLGICAGDLSFFWGYQALSEMKCAGQIPAIMSAVSRELAVVGAAQMQDVYYGHSAESPSIDDILNLYTKKTGRYSFSLPLVLGALIAGVPEEKAEPFYILGEKMGIVFQIKDDELGIFGNETGKVSGSDIRENKKSIFRHYLFSRIQGEDLERCTVLFGNPDISPDDISFVRAIIAESGIKKEINQLALDVSNEAMSIIDTIDIQPDQRRYLDILRSLVSFSLTREK